MEIAKRQHIVLVMVYRLARSAEMIRRFQHFINGHSTPPSSGEWIDSINPATGAVWAQIARGNKADVDLAVETALTASKQPDWRDSAANRSEIL